MEPLVLDHFYQDLYLEFPLLGDPFLDVTVLYTDSIPKTYGSLPRSRQEQNK